uniref:Uncharacterized protein n=1 Tax=Castor canadensis TaxID=51338 RepID=A0A8C0XJV2_CASCN
MLSLPGMASNSNPQISTVQVGGIIGISHCAWPYLLAMVLPVSPLPGFSFIYVSSFPSSSTFYCL